MEIFELLETLEDIIERSRNVPFSSKGLVDKEEMLVMESEYYMESDKIHIFPFISYTLSGEPIVEFYIWDCMLYPKVCKRFVIC